MTEFQDISCAFSYISGFIFLIGIIIYIYLLVVDSREEGTRSNSDTVWVWGMLVLLVIGFLISSYCIYGNSKAEDVAKKWAPKDPFNFLGNPKNQKPETRTPLLYPR